MPLYNFSVTIYGTVYVRAKTADAARRMVKRDISNAEVMLDEANDEHVEGCPLVDFPAGVARLSPIVTVSDDTPELYEEVEE